MTLGILCPKLQHFLSFKYNPGKTNAKFIKFLLNIVY